MDQIRAVRKQLLSECRPQCCIARRSDVRRARADGRAARASYSRSSGNAFDGAALYISRAVVMGEVKEPKTAKSKAWVALPKKLAAAIRSYRVKAIPPDYCDWMFPSERLTPLSVDNWRKARSAAGRRDVLASCWILRTFRRSMGDACPSTRPARRLKTRARTVASLVRCDDWRCVRATCAKPRAAARSGSGRGRSIFEV